MQDATIPEPERDVRCFRLTVFPVRDQVAGPELLLADRGAGLLLLVGLASRLAAIPLIVSMTVAILTAKRPDIGGPVDLFALDELVYLVLAVAILVGGAGSVAAECRTSRTRC